MRFVLLAILVLNTPVGATGFQSIESIGDAALAALTSASGDRLEAAVEPGLRLPQCAGELRAVPVNPSTVEVGCADAGWRLYVPIRAQRVQEVYVLRRPLAAGETIDASAVSLEVRDVSRIPGGVLTAADALDGRTARRAMMAGSVLMAQDAVPPRTIRRGDPVVLVSRMGAVEVRASGKALAAAGVDESVSVENSSSRRIVQGRVMANGEVLVR